MTGFALWTGCIHLLKCIKWKSSSICINLGPRLRGFGEVMLFIHHEVMVFFTVTLWPPMGTKHTHAHAIQAYCMCRVDRTSGKVSLSPCMYSICAFTGLILIWSCMDCVSMMMSVFRKDIIPGQNPQTLVIFLSSCPNLRSICGREWQILHRKKWCVWSLSQTPVVIPSVEMSITVNLSSTSTYSLPHTHTHIHTQLLSA